MLLMMIRVVLAYPINVLHSLFFFNRLKFDFLRSNLPLNLSIGNANVRLGVRLRVRFGVVFNVVSGNLVIGDRVFFNNYCSINCRESITVGDDVLFGESVKLYDHDHMFTAQFGVIKNNFKTKGIVIGNNVWLGSNVIVLKGVTIGDNAVIAAGSVVSKDVPASHVLINGSIKKIIE
ncbi:acyltransferase [Aeromonas sp. s8]|uniref:acyltransferase n=1 Tax=Aeromonas sp. s8 TaxID=3138489 RepID=UPI0034A31667